MDAGRRHIAEASPELRRVRPATCKCVQTMFEWTIHLEKVGHLASKGSRLTPLVPAINVVKDGRRTFLNTEPLFSSSHCRQGLSDPSGRLYALLMFLRQTAVHLERVLIVLASQI